jgi:2'-5' RNA ligase
MLFREKVVRDWKAYTTIVVTVLLTIIVLSVALSTSQSSTSSNSNAGPAAFTSLDIHLKLSADVEQQAILLNNITRQLDATTAIDLEHLQEPHITLYLTEFLNTNLDTLTRRISDAFATKLPKPFACQVQLPASVSNASAYVMWTVTNSPCLQLLSDLIVNATFDLAVPDQPVPSWVWSLDPAIAKLKAELVKKYGSPNVYSQFQPHVTVSADGTNPVQLGNAAQSLAFQSQVKAMAFQAAEVAISLSGPYGTCLRGQERALFQLNT